MGHASITVTAHTYADLFDDELDNIAVALDSLKRLLAEESLAADDSGRRVSDRQRRTLDLAKVGQRPHDRVFACCDVVGAQPRAVVACQALV
jgi:hypothetical protein